MNDVEAEVIDAESSTAFLQRLMEIDHSSELAELISGIAHELNQPLAAMATFSQAGARMLERPDPLTSRSLDVFRDISQEALQAGARLQRLRRLFDPGLPRQARCQMSDLVAEVTPVLNDLAASVNVQLQIDVSNELSDVFIDRLRIQKVLLALVRNAVDASASICAAPVIRLDVLAERYSVETGVTDGGGGVPIAIQQQIFRPFFTTKPSGHGLGLSSSQAIVESHGGTIGFTNLPGGAVRFWFRLPMASN
jgi:C4-dicarboxylate-specific signal transduction histidine kinase